MPGMNSGLNVDNPALVAAFRSALLLQVAVVIAIFIALMAAHWAARNWLAAAAPKPPRLPVPTAEPKARRLLRIGFGLLWILDGLLQAQPRMAGGLPSQVVLPVASASPGWVQHVVNGGGTIWSFHPVEAAASTVWIQAGLGLWLIAAETGWSSRLAGLGSVAWSLVVWVFGEAFGGIFAPGLSWLTGAPGAVALYLVAGALIALPLRAWAGPRLGRYLLAGTGLFWAGLALLQAWPGRGSWQGPSGMLTAMIESMSQLKQPHAQAAMESAVSSFTSEHGFAVNLFCVVALAALGLALASGRSRLLRVAVPAATGFCLVTWVLVQDLGVPGGLGTDPNSMVPWAVLLWAGYVALTQGAVAPDAAVVDAGQAVAPAARARFSLGAVRTALRPAALRQALGSASVRTVTALGAICIMLVGAAPMAAATADRNADPIIARAIGGAEVKLDRPAPPFDLVSEHGQPVSLASLRGKVLLLTFLDPVCTGCPVIAQELKQAGALLGPSDRNVELVAIAANSTHFGTRFTRAFDRNVGMAGVPNWLYLTGTLTQLQQVWASYEKVAPHMMVGMSVRSNVAFVIGKDGRIRQEIRDDPGPGTSSTRSSFAVLLSGAARQALALP
jgi:cytochrome oxidase Cu insertion factor (SCO1/SenC/PrrC family)